MVESLKEKEISAGLLPYFIENHKKIYVFLVTPGGPFYVNKESWGIAKGLIEENIFNAALREFYEETGIKIEEYLDLDFCYLGKTEYSNGKVVHAYTFKSKKKFSFIKSNTFSLEWPPKSGVIKEFPEIKTGKWFLLEEAEKIIVEKQKVFLEHLKLHLKNIKEKTK